MQHADRAVGSPKAERSVGLAIDLVSLLVNRAVVATTEQREIRQRRGAAVRPVADVMALTESHATAREAAASKPVVEPASESRRGGARAAAAPPVPALGVLGQ